MKLTPELKKRILTAIPGVAVLLFLLTLGGGVGATLVAAVISVAMIWEFTDITFSLPDKKEKRFILMGSAWLFIILNFWMSGAETALVVFFFLCMTSYFLFNAYEYEGDRLKTHYQELMISLFGFVYLALLPSYLVSLRQAAFGVHWTMLFLFIVWAGDTGAYFVGQKYGRQKLYPHISPKKTLEGCYGGVLAGVVLSVLYKLLFFKQLSIFGAICIPLIIGVTGPVGDLAESFLKRAYDKKDASQLLPGHGGFLDRFDSVIFSLPIMYALTRVFGAL